jgi:hypothetical protein
MDELLAQLTAARVRCLLAGGQAMRLAGMPRFSMDWDFFIPPRDEENFARLNAVLGDEPDMPLVPLGSGGENLVQTYQTRWQDPSAAAALRSRSAGWGVLQFHLGLPGVPSFDEAERHAVTRRTESGPPVPCLSGPQDQLEIEFLAELERLGRR